MSEGFDPELDDDGALHHFWEWVGRRRDAGDVNDPDRLRVLIEQFNEERRR